MIAHATSQGDPIHSVHKILQGYVMCGWIKTGILLPFSIGCVQRTMISNHPYRCWHPSQSINRCKGDVDITINHGDHIYTGHIISQGCVICGWMKTGILVAFVLGGMVYTMTSNHTYRCWHPSQSINGCTCTYEVYNIPLYKQPMKGIQSIQATQHFKDMTLGDGYKLAHFLILHWLVYDVRWSTTIYTHVDTHLS